MVQAIPPAARWASPADGAKTDATTDATTGAKAGVLTPYEFEIVRQAIAQALESGEDCEIEQMMRRRTLAPVRRRVQARIERDAGGTIAALRVAIEGDGEPMAAWTLPTEPAHLQDGAPAMIEAIDAFTAVLLQAEAMKRQVARNEMEEIPDSIEHILANVQRAWQRVGGLCRERVQPTS